MCSLIFFVIFVLSIVYVNIHPVSTISYLIFILSVYAILTIIGYFEEGFWKRHIEDDDD